MLSWTNLLTAQWIERINNGINRNRDYSTNNLPLILINGLNIAKLVDLSRYWSISGNHRDLTSIQARWVACVLVSRAGSRRHQTSTTPFPPRPRCHHDVSRWGRRHFDMAEIPTVSGWSGVAFSHYTLLRCLSIKLGKFLEECLDIDIDNNTERRESSLPIARACLFMH